jgi:hypothetical protein
MKKKAVSKSAKAKAPKKKAAKAKAKKTVKAKASKSAKAPKKAKAASPAKAKVKAKAKTKAKNGEHGLTVIDLFRMKQEREQQAAQDAEAWKHKKDLPEQDQHKPEDAKGPDAKKSGFGGVRHH